MAKYEFHQLRTDPNLARQIKNQELSKIKIKINKESRKLVKQLIQYRNYIKKEWEYTFSSIFFDNLPIPQYRKRMNILLHDKVSVPSTKDSRLIQAQPDK